MVKTGNTWTGISVFRDQCYDEAHIKESQFVKILTKALGAQIIPSAIIQWSFKIEYCHCYESSDIVGYFQLIGGLKNIVWVQ